MKKVWREPTLDEILNDPTLDTLLARDGVSKDELNRIIDEAREALARVPRSWQEGQEVFSGEDRSKPYLGGSLNTLFMAGLEAGQTLARSSPGFGSPRAALSPLHPNRIADHGPLSADLAAIRRE